MKILVTGGAGFIGSAIARHLKQGYPDHDIIALDNLSRRGSELNIPILKKSGVEFRFGDVRNVEDFPSGDLHAIIECSAEPSVLAARERPSYSVQTNLVGALNCWELARKHQARVIFLSTSRVYSIQKLQELYFYESETRFQRDGAGIDENFPTDAPRSLYGGTKLAAEVILQEYAHAFKIPSIINRCGVVAGPGQFGKADQGIVGLWVWKHLMEQPVTYIGYQGKQVRDILHIQDLCQLIEKQLLGMNSLDKGEVYNVGGGLNCNTSLLELSEYCRHATGKKPQQHYSVETRPDDVKWYIGNNTKVINKFAWVPRKEMVDVVVDTYQWMEKEKKMLKGVLE